MRTNEYSLSYGILSRSSAIWFSPVPHRRPGLFSRSLARAFIGLGGFASTLLFGFWTLYMRPAVPEATGTAALGQAASIVANPYGVLLDPRNGVLSAPSTPFPLVASYEPVQLAPSAARAPSAALAPSAASEVTKEPIAAVPELDEPAPLPVPRPPELSDRQSPSPPSGRRLVQQDRGPVVSTALPDNRSFIEKLLGFMQPSGSDVAITAPQKGTRGIARNNISLPTAGYDRWTAVYDIAARTVHLPNGKRLEAHSGLGDKLDDPRYVNVKMRGATPPNVYELKPREQLFHGVQALRLIPIGTGDLYGRTGLLAHTFMLGPNGDSNGCVSIKDYEAFLQAYQNGEIKRLVVVASMN
jgi:hypothetical protein